MLLLAGSALLFGGPAGAFNPPGRQWSNAARSLLKPDVLGSAGGARRESLCGAATSMSVRTRGTNQLSPGYNDITKGPDARHELMIRRAINFRMIQLKNISVGPRQITGLLRPARRVHFVPVGIRRSSREVLLEDRIEQFHRGPLHILSSKEGIEKLSAFQIYYCPYRAHGGIGGIPPKDKRGPRHQQTLLSEFRLGSHCNGLPAAA